MSSILLIVDYRDYITIQLNKRGGKPCVRGTRITIDEVLDRLASDMTEQEIIEDFRDLTREDVKACLAYAADRDRRPPTPDVPEERARLIDHVKVAYAIIIGIAVTDSIKNAAPWFAWNGNHLAPILFAVLFVTVVPIFHGGDRSLDVKFLKQRVTGAKRLEFVIQTTSLLITAILFVLAAENIPHQLEFATPTLNPNTVGNLTVCEPNRFYFWMAATVLWDVVVLISEYAYAFIKNRRDHLKPTLPWVPLNLGLGLVCMGLAFTREHALNDLTQAIALGICVVISISTLGHYISVKPGEKAMLYKICTYVCGCGIIFRWLQVTSADPASEPLAYLVLGIALGRSILDYSAGNEFMFPDKE